jgi:hypothetical protein
VYGVDTVRVGDGGSQRCVGGRCVYLECVWGVREACGVLLMTRGWMER